MDFLVRHVSFGLDCGPTRARLEDPCPLAFNGYPSIRGSRSAEGWQVPKPCVQMTWLHGAQ